MITSKTGLARQFQLSGRLGHGEAAKTARA
jgi:hypothetical protein